MSNKPGRNDPCPCGSGQKYKRCCLAKDQLAESTALAAAAAAEAVQHHHSHEECDFCGHQIDDEDELTRDSNAIVDLVHGGQLDQAEAAARELLERYPEVHDGYDRLGMVYEARGQNKQAADCYRKVIEFVRQHPDQYDPNFEKPFQGWVEELDPPVKCEDVTIRLLSSDLAEMVTLQHVLECAPGYAERVTGAPPGAADAQSTFTALPAGRTYEDKFVFGIFASNEMVGCIDLIRGYPTANAATLGLLLVAEQHQGMGIGRHAYALLERFASSWGNCDVIRLGVIMTNSEVLRFW